MRSAIVPPAPPKAAVILTLLVALLVPVATSVGLFVPGFYRDAAWMVPQARGQDLVTLLVAEPLLLWALLRARRGGVRTFLLWAGALAYVLYTYALYSYTAYFNALFLVYVALFAAALFALIDLLVHLDVAALRAAIRPTMPARAVGGFLAGVGALFLVAWLGQIVSALLRGSIPDSVTQAGTPSNGVYVQDLAVFIPLTFLACAWLWRRRPWGFALGGILLVLTVVMGLAVLTMALFMAQAGIAGSLGTAVLFAVVAAASLGVSALFAAHVAPPTAANTDTRPAGMSPDVESRRDPADMART